MAELTSEETKCLSNSCLQFALDIFKECNKTGMSNVILSPLSIGMALSMIYAGAKSVTREEMKKVLYLEKFTEDSLLHNAFQGLLDSLMKEQLPGLSLHIANRLYVEKETHIIDEYQKVLQEHYYSDIESVKFNEEICKKINAWVESKTNNKIKDLFEASDFDEMTRAVLVNAIYFKGNWKIKFDVSQTSPGDFYLNSDSKITVDMMHNHKRYYYGYNEEMNYQILGMPYINDNLLMYILLPDEKDDLLKLESSLTVESLQLFNKSLEHCKVIVTIPKFKIEWGMPIENILLTLGLSSLFSERHADLSGISSEEKLCVSSVVHKAFLEVNEEGTEAAAATGVMVKLAKSMDLSPEFVADHPFIVLIQDNRSGIILFIGKVTNPS